MLNGSFCRFRLLAYADLGHRLELSATYETRAAVLAVRAKHDVRLGQAADAGAGGPAAQFQDVEAADAIGRAVRVPEAPHARAAAFGVPDAEASFGRGGDAAILRLWVARRGPTRDRRVWACRAAG